MTRARVARVSYYGAIGVTFLSASINLVVIGLAIRSGRLTEAAFNSTVNLTINAITAFVVIRLNEFSERRLALLDVQIEEHQRQVALYTAIATASADITIGMPIGPSHVRGTRH